MTRFPFLFRLLPLALAFALLAVFTGRTETTEAIQIEPVVWTAEEDYPSDIQLYSDTQVPVQTVYLKTHDVGDWMSRYDKTSSAISGVTALQARVREYEQLGIEVIAWFVPGRDPDVDPVVDAERQRAMARAVLDSGVKGLYADVEPFDGFCNWDCRWAAENIWLPLRAERPDAHLGVIYDPRPHHFEQSATDVWLSVADVALPMCYWITFADQPPWSDPRGCVRSAYNDLASLTHGRTLEYVPMLQGDSTPELFRAAVEEAQALGLKRVSSWRRGVMAPAVWDAVAPLIDPVTPICARTLQDGCLLRENSSPAVWVLYEGIRYLIPSPESLALTGYDPNAVQVVPDGFLQTIPTVPPDGTILQEQGSADRYLVLAGARFAVTDDRLLALSKQDGPLLTIPSGSIAGVNAVPREGSWLKELSTGQEWFIGAGARFPIVDSAARDALVRGGHMRPNVVVIPQNSLAGVPTVPPDGARLRELSLPTVWQVSARVRFPIHDPGALDMLVAAQNLLPGEVIVPDGGLRLIPRTPPDGTLLKAIDGPAVYQVSGGQRWGLSSPESLIELIQSGAVNPNVYIVTTAGIEQISMARP